MSVKSKYGPLKRGQINSETGLRFWAYGKNFLNGEHWVTREAFDRMAARLSKHSSDNRESRRESVRKYRALNRDSLNAQVREQRKANPERAKEIDRKYNQSGGRERQLRYRARHKDKLVALNRANSAKRRHEKHDEYIAQKRAWTEANREKINAQKRLRLKADPVFALKNRLRTRTAVALQRRGYSKTSNTRLIIGCDWEALKTHIETRFAPGMSWDNRNLWHVDHIIPLSSANTERELIKLCHFTNLQPLWAFDNMSKGATHPFELWQTVKSA